MFSLLLSTGQRCAQLHVCWLITPFWYLSLPTFLIRFCIKVLLSSRPMFHGDLIHKGKSRRHERNSVSYLWHFMLSPPTQWDCNRRFEWHLWTEILKLKNTQLLSFHKKKNIARLIWVLINGQSFLKPPSKFTHAHTWERESTSIKFNHKSLKCLPFTLLFCKPAYTCH